MKIVLVLFIGLFLGFYAGRFTAPVPEPISPESSAPPLKAAPTPPPNRAQTVVSPSPNSTPTLTSTSNETNEEREANDSASKTEPTKMESPQENKGTPPDYKSLDLRVAERLEQRRRRNASKAINNSTPVDRMSPILRGLLGRFAGDILLDETTGRSWQIQMATEGTFQNEVFEGKSFIQLSRNGRPFSTSNNDGALKNIRMSGGSTASLWIQISDAFYLDAFYDANTDSLYGNFYGKNDKGEYRYRGYALMQRQ